MGEADIVCWDFCKSEIVLVEVRGSNHLTLLPTAYLTFEKKKRLARFANYLGTSRNCGVRIEFVEVVGRVPGVGCPNWLARVLLFFPEILGIKMRAWPLIL
jgi:Holliday junction resolvase-like predicted endonuclease